MEDFARALVDFVRDNQAWAAPIVLVLAFGESLAFISLLVPAWGALVAIGALIGVSGISFWPVWLAGGIGAALGDWVSYWFGYKYKEHVAEMWPLSRYPEILPRGEAFVQKWGVPSIFIRRSFSGRARLGAARRRHFRDVLLAVPDRQFRLRAGLVGRPAGGRDVMGKLAEWLAGDVDEREGTRLSTDPPPLTGRRSRWQESSDTVAVLLDTHGRGEGAWNAWIGIFSTIAMSYSLRLVCTASGLSTSEAKFHSGCFTTGTLRPP